MTDDIARTCIELFRRATALENSQAGAGISDAEILSRPLGEFELDSLETMEFIMAVEDSFNVELDEKAVNACASLSDFVTLIAAERRV